MHVEATSSFRHVVAARFINVLDMLPAHTICGLTSTTAYLGARSLIWANPLENDSAATILKPSDSIACARCCLIGSSFYTINVE